MDRFDALTHDLRVVSYVKEQDEVRKQWNTDGPRRLLDARAAGGLGTPTGGLARELERTARSGRALQQAPDGTRWRSTA